MDIGGKLRSLRQIRGLTQEELADRSELSKGFISQVERNLTSPSIATLTDILESLGTDLKSFFNTELDEKITYSSQDMFEKNDDEELKGTIRWLIPNCQGNQMEPILVTMGVGGKTYEVTPHEGEEFGYVLKGEITLHIGEEAYRLKSGESFSLHPGENHHLENTGNIQAKVIWVSSPPSF